MISDGLQALNVLFIDNFSDYKKSVLWVLIAVSLIMLLIVATFNSHP